VAGGVARNAEHSLADASMVGSHGEVAAAERPEHAGAFRDDEKGWACKLQTAYRRRSRSLTTHKSANYGNLRQVQSSLAIAICTDNIADCKTTRRW
jgi:hypothetical protein